MPDFSCNLSQAPQPFPHFWEHTVGSGHAPLALRADWQAQLLRCHRELGFQHVRFHGILSDDMGTLVCEEDKILYSFFNADQIIDFLLSIGMRPFVELSFMPKALASGNTTVFSYCGNVTPPKDFGPWATLIGKIVGHWVERYGAEEVREWFFEVWNEPNLKAFWTGSQEEYFQFYACTAAAIKKVDSRLKVGGPVTADNQWIPEFLAYCKKNNAPVDFVSTHHYPTDAFGKPGADTTTQLQHSPRYDMRDETKTARAQAGDLPLYYTEWSISSNPRGPFHDHPFAAAFATRIIMEARGFVEGYSFWTFSDIFCENYFPCSSFQGGFGLLTIHGIAKPVYRAFALLHNLGTNWLDVEGSHSTVNAWVVSKENSTTVLLTNLVMPRASIQTELVNMRLSAAKAPRRAWIERIDEDHANPYRRWVSLGQPEYLSPIQVAQIESASAVCKEAQPWKYDNGIIDLDVALAPTSVAAITLEFA